MPAWTQPRHRTARRPARDRGDGRHRPRAAGVPDRRLAPRRLGARAPFCGSARRRSAGSSSGCSARTGNLAAAGVAGFLMLFRAIAVMVVVFAVVTTNKWLGLAAALTYAAAYTRVARPLARRVLHGPGSRKGFVVKRALALCADARARRARRRRSPETFDPSAEFEQKTWLSIHLGPLDLSITKAVVYLFLARRRLDAPRHRADAREGPQSPASRSASRSTRSPRPRSPSRGCRRRRSAAGSRSSRRLMIFIWVVNMLGFVPLPLSGETWHHIPVVGHLRRDDRPLSVTLALALMTVRLHPLRGHPLRTARSSTSRAGSPRCPR